MTPDVQSQNFGQAVEALKNWKRVARIWWNWKGMFLYYVPENFYKAQTEVAKKEWWEWEIVPYWAYIAMKTAQWNVVPWLASQIDVLAEDWVIFAS